jgi:hypothetical protein
MRGLALGSAHVGATVRKRALPVAAAVRRPNLFVIGAMKSGTTYLNKLLNTHPQIFMCTPEEPSYFVEQHDLRRLWPKAWDLGFWRDEDCYLSLFEAADDAVFVGEASTSYTKRIVAPGVPERIRRFNPDARFVYVMRDPVQRTISHYWHMVRFHAEKRPMLEAIKAHPHYLDTSHYARQLLPYLDLFGPERVFTLTFDELTQSPRVTMSRLFAWLGLDSRFVNGPGWDEAENTTPAEVRIAAGQGLMRRVQQWRPVRTLLPHLPNTVRRIGLRIATREIHWRSVDTAEVADFLRPIQHRQTEELAMLLERSFPEWNTLYLGTSK